MTKATMSQYLQVGAMIDSESLDRKTVQAIIEGRIEIIDQPREQTGSPYRGNLPVEDLLPPGHYRIRVNRGPLPSFDRLEDKFGRGNVSSLFDGRPWTKHEKRLENDVIAWGLKHGYVPSEEKEAYAVSRDPQTRALQYGRLLVALGSDASHVFGGRYVAVLSASVFGRVFVADRYDGRWDVGCRFLFVRK